MRIQHVPVKLAILGLFFVTASLAGAGGGKAERGAPFIQPAFPLAGPASCQLKAGGGGNCDTDADCPAGSYCYHDPIALVPYCVAGSGDSHFEF